MAHNESSDSEFDQELERTLRRHFEAEASELSAPGDTWARLESRMEEPEMPSFFSRILGAMSPVRQGRLQPAFAVAGVAVVAVAVAVVALTLSGGGGSPGQDPEGALISVAATKRPQATPSPAPLAAAQSESLRSPSGEGRQAAASSVPAPGTPAPASAPITPAASVAAPTPAPASAPRTRAAVAVAIPTAAPAPALGTQVPTTVPAAAAQATPLPAPTLAAMAMAMEAAAEAVASAAPPADAKGVRGPQGSAASTVATGSPPDTNFRDYQRQPFVAASEDNISTFSLDTDRTSYHLALNWARSGYEIDPDSVRAEEWLNSFDYQYDAPTGSNQFAVASDLFPHPLDESKRLARISFQAPELVAEKPLNVTLVLDASGSMADGDRVGIARQAAESIRQSLGEEDRMAVVHFSTDVLDQYTVNHSTPDDQDVKDSISWLQPHDSTNVQAGLNLGVRLADDARESRPDSYNYVILMSDGVANVDATNPFAILETAYDANARNPLRLIAIGVGINNYNDLLLEQLAQHGNGWYRYLDTREQAQATFSRENWLALSLPFADQTRAQVTWDTESVERWRIVGYENRVTDDENFTQDRKEFAEIYSGAATTVLYELELTEQAQSLASVSLGQVELRWVDSASGDSHSQTAMLSGSPSGGFEGETGPLAHFGAIVALAADLYGTLPSTPENESREVHNGLSILSQQLDTLDDELGELDSYRDFLFLLEHIAGNAADRLPPSTPSGYSR